MAIRTFTAMLQREGDGYVALCPELDVASQGDTVEPDRTVTVPVPDHSEIRLGTLASIIRQSELPRSLFET